MQGRFRLAALSTALVACATATRLYEGPPRAPSEVVHVSIRPAAADRLSLNGVTVRGYSFELEPGPIAVEFEMRRSGYGEMATLGVYGAVCRAAFEGKAGMRYRIDGGQRRGETDAHVPKGEKRTVYESQLVIVGWIEEVGTGHRIEANCEAF